MAVESPIGTPIPARTCYNSDQNVIKRESLNCQSRNLSQDASNPAAGDAPGLDTNGGATPNESAPSAAAPGTKAAPKGMGFDPLARKKPGSSKPPRDGSGSGEQAEEIDDITKGVVELLAQLNGTAPGGGADPQDLLKQFGGPGAGLPGAELGRGPAFGESLEDTLRELQGIGAAPGPGPSSSAAGGPAPAPFGFDPATAFGDADLDGLADQFAGMGAKDTPEMQSLMDAIMKQLLSKEVLYDPLREIGGRYPQWIEENKDRLGAEDLERYTRQLASIERICAQYDEAPDDFPALMGLLQEMQECGQPPDEIVQELAPGMAFGSDGLPFLPSGGAPGAGADPGQCVVM